MQITDINDFISTAAQLLNAPDLILIAVLLANVWLGARRGLVGALYGVIGRIGMIAASVAAAKYTAPYIAQWVVVPAVGQLFEKQAALKTAEGVLGRSAADRYRSGCRHVGEHCVLHAGSAVQRAVRTAHLDFRPAASSSLFGVLRSAHSIPQAAHSSAL